MSDFLAASSFGKYYPYESRQTSLEEEFPHNIYDGIIII